MGSRRPERFDELSHAQPTAVSGQPCPPRLDNGKFGACPVVAGDQERGGDSAGHMQKSHPTARRTFLVAPEEDLVGGGGSSCSPLLCFSAYCSASSDVGGTALFFSFSHLLARTENGTPLGPPDDTLLPEHQRCAAASDSNPRVPANQNETCFSSWY